MLKLFIVAGILACTDAFYNHGPQPYYGNYGHVVNAAPIVGAPAIPVNPHHGNIYNHGYGNLGGLSSHGKIVAATYPGAVHKSATYGETNPTGYYGAEYVQHGSSSGFVNPSAAVGVAVGQNGPIPYNHPAPAAVSPSISYNHASVGNYAHSRYAVTEGPNYAHSRYAVTEGPNYAHSRYSISHSPALSYGQARYPVADHGLQKIGYNPILSHMAGYTNHAAQNYAW